MQAVFVSTGSRDSPLHSGKYTPFNYYEFYMTYKITWNKGCITSLYIDEYTYLGSDGVVLYFQQYDIAPYAAGFPEFSFGITDIDT